MYFHSLPRSRFLDVTQRSAGGVLRDIQKTAARETSVFIFSFIFSNLCDYPFHCPSAQQNHKLCRL